MRNFNLTQMLQGCSKRNGMTVSASMHDDGQNCNVTQRTELTSEDEKWSEKGALSRTCPRFALVLPSFCSRLDSVSIVSRQSDLDQVRAISVGLSARVWKYVAMILAVLVMSIANIGTAWGGAGYYEEGGNAIQLRFLKDGGNEYWANVGATQASAGDLGTIYELTLDKFYVYVWREGVGISWSDLQYRIYKEGDTAPDWSNYRGYWLENKTGNKAKYGKDGGMNINCLAGNFVPGATYIFEYCVNSDQAGWRSNNSNNYKFKFTIANRYLAASFARNTWSTKDHPLENGSITIHRVAGSTACQYKLTLFGTYDHAIGWNELGDKSSCGNATISDGGASGHNIKFTTPAGGPYNVTITYNGHSSCVTCTPISCPSSNSGQTVYKFTTKSSGLETGNICGNKDQDYPQTTTNALSELVGGTLAARASSANTGNLKYNNNSFNFNGGSSGWLILGLDCSIQEGDQIKYRYLSGSGTTVQLSLQTAKGTTTNQISLNGATATHGTIQTVEVTAAQASAFGSLSNVYLVRTGSNTAYLDYLEIFRPAAAVCSATAPGTISKGSLSGCSLPLTADGDPASNNTWYWQSAEDGTDKTGTSGATKNVTSAGTYYVRSFYSTGSCWSDAQSITVTAADLTPAAPTALAASSVTAKGVTLTVTDAANTNDYEFYVSTSSPAPGGSTPATHSSNTKSITITNLYAGTTFYAWARAKCGSNKSAWTALTDDSFETSTVSAAYHLTNVTKTSGATSGIGGSTFTAVFSANTDYSMPTPVVTIGGNSATSGTDYTWTAGTGTLTINADKINGDIDITMSSPAAAPSSVSITGNYHIYPGETLELTATPTGGNGPKTYQWQKYMGSKWTDLDGETSNTYTKASVTTSDVGHYRCIVTCAGTLSTTSGQFDVKCLQLYVYYNDKTDLTNVPFTKVDDTHATASVLLGNSSYCYHFKVTDGCGNWWGNNGESGMSMSNHDNWSLDGNYYTKLWTSKAGTYRFNLGHDVGLTSYGMSVVFPSGTQAAGYNLYFANDETEWNGSKIYYRIGKSSHNNYWQMNLVPGTANLYKVTTTEYGGFEAWHIANNRCGGNSTSIYKTNTNDDYEASAAMMFNGTDIASTGLTVIPDVNNHWAGTGDGADCEFYGYNTVDGMKTDRVTITAPSNGTLTVNYVDVSGAAQAFSSGNRDLAHTVILTSITTSPNAGYDAGAITINGDPYSANYVVTGETTIAASFTLKTYTISYNKGTNGTGSKASETKTHGVNFTLPGSTFTYGGHAQDGWSTSDGGALAYALSGSYTTNAAQEFFPHWKCNTPSITDNGDNTVSITVPSGTTVRYTTDGTDPSSSTGTVYSTTFSIAADCTVKAIAYQSNCTDSEIASQACDYTAPANFQMIATTSGSDATLTHNDAISAGSKNCATLSGGTAKYIDEDAGASQKMTVKSGESYGWNFNRNKDQIVITLSGHVLQEGSVITVSGYANADLAGFKMNGVTIFSKTSGSGSFADQSYTVLSTDEALINKNVLTLTRNSGSGAYLHSITISNCLSGTPCVTPVLPSLTTPNQACTTGEFAAWNATVSNAAAISAAAGSQTVSYSWKNSSSVEVATTAAYTPTAAGTYTVTATVHSDEDGYIDASVTSSTLTASLYGNPSVTGPSDANYVVGASASNLSVTATPTHGESLTYQWYSNTAKSTSSPTPTALENCTTSTYKPSTAAAATTYYFCKVSGGCEDVYSSIATVTVTEAPCFKFTCESQSSSVSSISAGSSITTASWESGKATLSGGTMTNSAASQTLNVNKTYGLVFDSNNNEVTVTLSGDNVLAKDAVITLNCATVATKDAVCGFKINGNNMSPESYTATAASNETFTQSYTIPAASALIGTKSFKITRYNSNKVYLNGITVTGCDECEGITPSLSYSKTTLWVNDGDTSTPTLDTDESTGSVTYSSNNTDVATVNESTGVVTAVAGGSVTITASIAADGTHCANTATCNLTIKQATCGEVVIAGVTLTAKNAGTPEGTLIASSSGYVVSTQKWEEPDGGCGTGGKLGESGNYICLTLKSGESFKNGDKVILDIATVPDIGDGKLHIYAGTSSAGTQLGVNASPVCGENEITLSGISTSTPSITLYRTSGDDKQNPYVVSMKVKRFICTDCLGFVDATENGNWNTAGNWIGSTGVSASVPTISDRVHIYKPVTVDINNARASSVYIYTNSTNTGKVTIDAGKALIIAGKLAKSTNGTSYTTTAAADVIINSTRAAGVGALIIGGETGANQATVNFATKAKNDGGWVNQFIGSPFSDNEPYVDYALQLYKFVPRANGDRGWWSTVHEGDEMEEFWGYNVLYNDASELDVTWTGTLNASTSKTISGLYYNGSSETDNMFANSWTAPIHVGAIEDADLPNASKTLYMFNAGTPAQEEGQNGSNAANNNTSPGTYISIPIHSAPYAGIGVIPSMQAFYVEAQAAEASITLDYNKVVYTPALTSVGIVPNRAPKRGAEVEEPEVIKLHVQSETGWGANTYVLSREDFSEGYEDGWDGAYIEGESATPKLYTPSIDGNMFINCLPEIEGTVVGFRKGSSDNNYIFSFDYDGDEVWYLNDQKAQKSTQIMNGQTYAFVSEAGDNAARFVISATPINKIATGCESVGAEAAKVRKLIINDKVYIIRGGQVFDVLGKTIKK